MALTKVTGELVDIGDLDISNVGSIQLDSIAGDADTNTTIAFPGSDVITMSTGGSERLRVDASGQIGIGTTSPDTPLEISTAGSGVTDVLKLTTTGTGTVPSIVFEGDQGGTQHTVGRIRGGQEDASNGNLIFEVEDAGSLDEAVRIDSSGNVGIGTSSPSDVLDITRTSTDQTVGLTLTNLQSGGYGSGMIFRSKRSDTSDIKDAAKIRVSGENSWNSDSTTDSVLVFDLIKDNSLSEKMRIASSGDQKLTGGTDLYVDLFADSGSSQGSASFRFKSDGSSTDQLLASIVMQQESGGGSAQKGEMLFQVSDNANPTTAVKIANNKDTECFGRLASKYDGSHHVAIRGLSGGQYIQYSSASPLEFVSVDTYPNSGATSRARLTTSGHWLVGTTSSTINSSNFGAVIFSDGRPKFSKNVSGASHVMNVYGNEGEMRVFGDGDVINTNNSYGQISDVSLKENIVDATDKLNEINQIRVRNFNFIGDDLKQIGVIAQELETVFPALVTTDEEEDIKTVKYSVFVPILIKALQEADDKIDALEARITELESS